MESEKFTIGLLPKKGQKGTIRYIQWCDDKWYETISVPNYIYTQEEMVKLTLELLPKHYINRGFVHQEGCNYGFKFESQFINGKRCIVPTMFEVKDSDIANLPPMDYLVNAI